MTVGDVVQTPRGRALLTLLGAETVQVRWPSGHHDWFERKDVRPVEVP